MVDRVLCEAGSLSAFAGKVFDGDERGANAQIPRISFDVVFMEIASMAVGSESTQRDAIAASYVRQHSDRHLSR